MKAFVLMPFAPPIGGYYDHIFKPALEAAGCSVSRADDLFAPRPIILDIQESIQDADLLLCEMTGKNPNVFYELGLAHALGKSTILVARREEDIPFDLRHIRVILYEPNEAGWKQSLRRRITEAAKAAQDSRPSWPPPLLPSPQHNASERPEQTAARSEKSRFDALKKDSERVLVRFPTENERVVSGPYPYRFVVHEPNSCALLLEARIWASKSAYENVIQVSVDDKHVAEIRQGYERFHSLRIELGHLASGRHTIAFEPHYEGLDGGVIEDKLNEARRYWVLQQLVVVGEPLG